MRPNSVAAQAREPNGGLIALPDTFLAAHHPQVASLAAHYRLPAITPWRFNAELGGLLSYGLDVPDNFRRAAGYVDRILKGEKPADLPVQAPVKFELVINLKTAKALGLDVPLHLQQRADEIKLDVENVEFRPEHSSTGTSRRCWRWRRAAGDGAACSSRTATSSSHAPRRSGAIAVAAMANLARPSSLNAIMTHQMEAVAAMQDHPRLVMVGKQA
jgi:ABC transporter substrate binding protein